MDAAQDALDDWSLLIQVTGRLAAADSVVASLQALTLPSPAPGEGEVCLWTIDEYDGVTSATIVAVAPAEGRPARAQVGTRWPLSRMPLTGSLVDGPMVPVLSANISDDPRIDADLRRTLVSGSGVDAMIGIGLTLRGQLAGLLTIVWPRPLPLGPREHRLYSVLASHAVLLLDAYVKSERQRVLQVEVERERRLVATVMDHVPVGILCIDGPSRNPLLTNRMARVLLAGSPDPVSGPLPIAHMLLPGTDQPIDASQLAGVRAARTGVRQSCDLDLKVPGGPRVSVETIGVPVHDADGKVDQVVVVMTDITGRKQAAEERARLQEEVIAAQAAALIERSTPLIPITDDVLVMPLIGTIDRERGQGVLAAALQGARDRRARVTILDITGVPAIDDQAAAALTRTAQALRLLGVEPVLSGVRPAVAQALLALETPLTGIVTCGSLQAGIEYALRRLGQRR